MSIFFIQVSKMVDKYQEKGPRLQARQQDNFTACALWRTFGYHWTCSHWRNSLPQQNALFYVGGYVCKKYLAKHICKECTSSLTCSELSDLSDSSTTFLQQKSYNSVSSGKSGLAIPSSALVLFLKKCEDVFVSHFMGIMHMSKVCQRLVS